MDWSSIVLLAISGVATVACWVGLWRGCDSLWSKLGWSFLAAVPVFGPVLYAGVHRAPRESDGVDQAQESAYTDSPDVGSHSSEL